MALSGIQLSAGIVVGSNTSVDAKYGPYADVATANSEIGSTLRYKGLTVGILVSGSVVEYWYKDGTTDVDLVEKSSATAWGDITGTLSDQTDLQNSLNAKISTYDGTTYDVTALAAVTQAEYNAIGTKSATTLYFII